MKIFIVSCVLTFVGSCATVSHVEKIQQIENGISFKEKDSIEKYAKTITPEELKSHVYTLASDEFEGRAVGNPGHQKAVDYLKDYYQSIAITSKITNDTYLQEIPSSYFSNGTKVSYNVISHIQGIKYPEEYLIISAHSDHVGVKGTNIYNGADDNASGTSAILEIAEAFKLAQENGNGPDRSIVFIHFTGEEIGLTGSRYYTENPLFPLEQTVADLNIDMIGRVDNSHENNENYIYLIGSDRLSTELHYISEHANNLFTQLDIDYKYNADDDHNRYYYRSDHYNFARNGIPVIFFFNGEHDDYHEPTDTADKINYQLLAKRSQLIFATAWYLANSERRVRVDKSS